jgi:hypothetical protein
MITKLTLESLKSDVKFLTDRNCGCVTYTLERTENNTSLVLVVGWSDGFEKAEPNTPMADGTWRICAKIGYQGRNEMTETDMDFVNMPYDKKSGDVDDTSREVELTQAFVDEMNAEAERVWADWKDELDSLVA